MDIFGYPKFLNLADTITIISLEIKSLDYNNFIWNKIRPKQIVHWCWIDKGMTDKSEEKDLNKVFLL